MKDTKEIRPSRLEGIEIEAQECIFDAARRGGGEEGQKIQWVTKSFH